MDNTDAALSILNNPSSTDEERAFASKIIDGVLGIKPTSMTAVSSEELTAPKSDTAATTVTDAMLAQLRADFKANIVSPRPPSAETLKFEAQWARFEEVCVQIAKLNPNDLNFGNPRYIAALEFNVWVWGGKSRMSPEQFDYVYHDDESYAERRVSRLA